MVEEDDSLAAFVATLLFFGADILNDAGVPTFGWGIHNEFADRRNIFRPCRPPTASAASTSCGPGLPARWGPPRPASSATAIARTRRSAPRAPATPSSATAPKPVA